MDPKSKLKVKVLSPQKVFSSFYSYRPISPVYHKLNHYLNSPLGISRTKEGVQYHQGNNSISDRPGKMKKHVVALKNLKLFSLNFVIK